LKETQIVSKIGRPSVLDDHKKDIICAVARVGGSIRQAAAIVGCCESTIRYGLAHDPEFNTRWAQAQAKAQIAYLRRVQRNSKRSWRAAAWALERLCPEEFGSTQERMAARNQDQLAEQLPVGSLPPPADLFTPYAPEPTPQLDATAGFVQQSAPDATANTPAPELPVEPPNTTT
jgi:hypothetical protein